MPGFVPGSGKFNGRGAGGVGSNSVTMTNVQPGNALVACVAAFSGSANAIGSSALSDDKSNTWTRLVEFAAGSENVAIYVALNVAANDTVVTCLPSSGTFQGLAVGEFWGVLRASASEGTPVGNSGSSTSATGSNISVSSDFALLISALTHGFYSGDQSMTPGSGFSGVAEGEDYNTYQPVSMEYKVCAPTGGSATNFAATWGLSDGSTTVPWRMASVVLQGPSVQGDSKIVDDAQTMALSLPVAPSIGSVARFALSLYKLDPTTSMFTDNNGHTWVRDVLRTWVGGDSLNPGCAVFSTTVTANSTTPFTINFDSGATTPGDNPGRFWTAAIENDSYNYATVDTTATNGGSGTQDPGPGSMTTSHSAALAFCMLAKRAHQNDYMSMATDPTLWFSIINNPENSAHQAGIFAFVVMVAAATINPTFHLFNTDSTDFRAAGIIYSAGGGGGFTPKQRRTFGPRVGSRELQFAA